MNNLNIDLRTVPAIARNKRIYTTSGTITNLGSIAVGGSFVDLSNYVQLTGTTQKICSNINIIGALSATSICSDNIGIGAVPSYPLDIEKNSSSWIGYMYNSNASGTGLLLQKANDTLQTFSIRNCAGTETFKITGNGETTQAGNINFTNGANRCIILPSTTTTGTYDLNIVGQSRTAIGGGCVNAGNLNFTAGYATGYANAQAGDITISAGIGCGSASSASCGGDVIIKSGNACLASGAGSSTAGSICLAAGTACNAGGTCVNGSIQLYHLGAKTLETTAAGVTICGDEYITNRLGVGVVPTIPLQVQGSVGGNVIAQILNTCNTGYGLAIRNGTDTHYSLNISNAANSYNSIELYGSGLIKTCGAIVTSNCICADNHISCSTPFLSGFMGSGYKIWCDSTGYNMELDNLSIRQNLCAQTFLINETKASNGDLVITDSMCGTSGFTCAGAGCKYYFYSCSDVTFRPNDIIRSQSMACNNIYSYTYTVYCVDAANNRVYVNESAAGVDASNKPFVRLGNTTDTARQSMIYLTPYCGSAIKVYNGVNSTTITAANEVTRLGNLEGLTGTTGGYGLYSTNAFLTGTVNAVCGNIAGFCINGQSLNNNSITLNNSCISIADSTGTEKVSIKNCGLTAIAQLVGASCVTIPISCNANCLGVAMATNSSTACSIYYQQKTAASNAAASYYTSCQASKNFTLTCNKNYVVSASVKLNTYYTLTADIDCKTACCYCKTYVRCGNYLITGNTTLYDCTNAAIITNNWSTGLIVPNTGYVDNIIVCTIPAQTVCIPQAAIYEKTCYCIVNTAYQNQTTTCYFVAGGKYYTCLTATASCNLTNNIRIQGNSLNIIGAAGVTEIGSCGFQSVYNTTNYFRYDPVLCTTSVYGCLAVNGTCATICAPTSITGNLGVINTTTNYNSSASITMGSCNIYLQPCLNTGAVIVCAGQNTANAAIMCVANTIGLASNPAINLQAGCNTQTSGCHLFVNFYNNTPACVGSIRNNAGTIQFVSASDCRLKCCIMPTTMSGIQAINAVTISDYVWIGDTGNTKQIGFIAQDNLPAAICKFVDYNENNDVYGITQEALIPYLAKAVQELTACINELKTCINNL